MYQKNKYISLMKGDFMVKLDFDKIDNITFDGIDYNDYPDFCDVYADSADYDGASMTQDQLDELNKDREFVYEKLMDFIH